MKGVCRDQTPVGQAWIVTWCVTLSLSLSLLTWPPCIYSILNVRVGSSLPGTQARGSLGTVSSGLLATLYLHPSRPPQKHLWLL